MSRLDRSLLICLGLQALTVPLVISIFKLIEPRVVAATVAGSWFVLSSGVMLFVASRRVGFLKSAFFWAAAIFCLGFSVPMLFKRVSNWETPFDQITIWGVPGPAFHGISNSVFLALVAATVFELWRTRTNVRQTA